MADVSVREARPGDADDIGRVQIATWQIGYASILPPLVLVNLSIIEAGAAWLDAITDPPSRRHHVLVALEQNQVVGFAVSAPADDLEADDPEPDSTVLIGPLLVEARWGRRGHGSRLLAAAVDLARTDGQTRAIAWLPEADTTSRGFFASAGWAADGYARALDTGAGELREVRIHSSLSTAETG
jgi:GNAT superfamily N-acetyltransferase